MSSKPKPNVITPFNDKQRFKNLVLEVIKDMEVFTHVPDSISLDGNIFTLTLSNKKLVYQDVSVDALRICRCLFTRSKKTRYLFCY